MPSHPESCYWFMNVGEGANPRRGQPDEGRSWEDCVKYGFMAMGGGESWIDRARQPVPGDYLFAYLNKHGYVGCGEVVAAAVSFRDFVPQGEPKSLMKLVLSANVQRERMLDPTVWDMCIGVRWIKTLERDCGVNGTWVSPSPLCRLRKVNVITALLERFDKTHARP